MSKARHIPEASLIRTAWRTRYNMNELEDTIAFKERFHPDSSLSVLKAERTYYKERYAKHRSWINQLKIRRTQ